MYEILEGHQIKNIRAVLGLKRREVAEFCNCSKSYIDKLERGERQLCGASKEFRDKIDRLAKIAVAYARTRETTAKKSLLQKIKEWFIIKFYK